MKLTRPLTEGDARRQSSLGGKKMKKHEATTHGGPIGSEQRSPNWGGTRDGAGRPKGSKTHREPDAPAARVAVGWYRLTQHVADNLETAAHLDGVKAADIVAALLSMRFRCSCPPCSRARKSIPMGRHATKTKTPKKAASVRLNGVPK